MFGNDRFEGYTIDLIDELAKYLHFKYEFILREDKDYGSPIPGTNNQWTGMIGEVMNEVNKSYFFFVEYKLLWKLLRLILDG